MKNSINMRKRYTSLASEASMRKLSLRAALSVMKNRRMVRQLAFVFAVLTIAPLESTGQIRALSLRVDSLDTKVKGIQGVIDSLLVLDKRTVDISSALEIQNQLAANKQATYDSALSRLQVAVELAGLVLAIILFIFGFLGLKSINEIREDVRKELEREDSDRVKKIVENTMKSIYEKPIEALQDQVSSLEDKLANRHVFGRSRGEKKPAGKRETPLSEDESGNVFGK